MEKEDRTEQRIRARRKLSLVVAAICGGGLSLIIAVAGYIAAGRGSQEHFSHEDLAIGIKRWADSKPHSYDIEIKLTKQRTEVHRVEVRDGRAVRYTINDREMTRRRTFDTWTVPGMFGTVERDLENVRLVKTDSAEAYTPRLTLWGSLHPKYGYPERYRRVQLGADFQVSWEVTEFTVTD